MSVNKDWYKELIVAETILEREQAELNALSVKIRDTEREINLLDDSIVFLNKYIEAVVGSNSSFIENMVTNGLRYVFGTRFTFKINHDIKNHKNVFFYSIINEDTDVTGNISTFGGGVMAITSFIIRFAINILTDKARIMLLDESLNHVSAVYQDRTSSFLKTMCDEFDFTIVLVTHQQQLCSRSDEIIELVKIDGELKRKI